MYVALADELSSLVKAGKLKSGDRLPSVRRLMTQRGVSATTAIAALRAASRGSLGSGGVDMKRCLLVPGDHFIVGEQRRSMPTRFTIVGGRGFIGTALAASLRSAGHEVTVATHRDDLAGRDLHHAIYASGIAASSADDPGYAFGVHVEGARRLLTACRFDSFLYLSSTRVYGNGADTSESAVLPVAPAAAETYRISKIAGETLCLAQPNPAVRVARLSNIAGPSFDSPLFLSDVLRQAVRDGRAAVRTLRASAKDYLSIDDACRYLTAIALRGGERIYNVAAGRNISNGAIYDALAALGVEIAIDAAATLAVTPPIDARRLQAEFGPPLDDVVALLPATYDAFARHAKAGV